MKIDTSYHVLDGSIKTIVFTAISDISKFQKNTNYIQIDFSKNTASQICEKLHQYEIQSIIIEGGAQTLQTFINANLWDEAFIFTGITSFKNGIKAPQFSGKLNSSVKIEQDILKTFVND